MPVNLPIDDFVDQVKLSGKVIIDARSEGEFQRGHIPGAVNIPLLNNDHRVTVGTTYKQKGRSEAVLKGFELVGPLFHEIILKTKSLCRSNEVMVYCWRGGMRSSIFCWLLDMAGFKTTVLRGGYKAFRHWCINQFALPRAIIVLGGKTGSGKTEVLQHIRNKGQQVICLESLASHKGSAFGALGQDPQPTQEHFENKLAFELSNTRSDRKLWLENESRNVGSVKIPDSLYEKMRTASVVEMNVERSIREGRILNEYGGFPKELLAEKTMKLEKRMGGQNVRAAVNALHEDDWQRWVSLLMDYYDRTYDYSSGLRFVRSFSMIDVSWNNIELEVSSLIELIKVRK